MSPDKLSMKYGIGEVYRVHAQIRAIEQLKKMFRLKEILEFPPDPVAADFPITWKQTDSPAVDGDLLFTWRAFPLTVYQMINYFKGSRFLFIASNKFNLGALYLKIMPPEPEILLSRKGIIRMAESFGLNVLYSGYFDSPPWPDVRLPGNRHLKRIDQKVADSVHKWGNIPGHFFRAHHVYCLAERRKS